MLAAFERTLFSPAEPEEPEEPEDDCVEAVRVEEAGAASAAPAVFFLACFNFGVDDSGTVASLLPLSAFSRGTVWAAAFSLADAFSLARSVARSCRRAETAPATEEGMRFF